MTKYSYFTLLPNFYNILRIHPSTVSISTVVTYTHCAVEVYVQRTPLPTLYSQVMTGL